MCVSLVYSLIASSYEFFFNIKLLMYHSRRITLQLLQPHIEVIVRQAWAEQRVWLSLEKS